MIPDGRYTAVVDRIEDGLATLELTPVADSDEAAADADHERYGLDVSETELPDAARRANALLEVELVDEELVAVEFDPEATEERETQAQNRFDRLSSRPPRDEDSDAAR